TAVGPSGESWLSVSNPNGNGNGTVSFYVGANAGNGRIGAITIWNQKNVVIQAGNGSGTYTLKPLEVTPTYPTSNTSAASDNPIQAGKQIYPLNQLVLRYPLGWDYLWGTPQTNHQRFVGSVFLGDIPQAVTPGLNAPVAAGITADWNSGPGY